jgi:hypothetical protein
VSRIISTNSKAEMRRQQQSRAPGARVFVAILMSECLERQQFYPESLIGNGGADGPGQIVRVLLTGGSSEWPFMKDLAAKVFGVDAARIIRSASPELTIGSGLAIYNVLSRRYEVA